MPILIKTIYHNFLSSIYTNNFDCLGCEFDLIVRDDRIELYSSLNVHDKRKYMIKWLVEELYIRRAN